MSGFPMWLVVGGLVGLMVVAAMARRVVVLVLVLVAALSLAGVSGVTGPLEPWADAVGEFVGDILAGEGGGLPVAGADPFAGGTRI